MLVLTAVFCLFASVGLMALQMHTDRVSNGKILFRVLLSGGFAIGYAGLAMARRVRYLPVLVIAQVLIEIGAARVAGGSPSLAGQPEALQRQLTLLASLAMTGIIVAYSVMIQFLGVEGKRYFQARTEIALASEIHSSLVPVCTARSAADSSHAAFCSLRARLTSERITRSTCLRAIRYFLCPSRLSDSSMF